MEQNTDNIKKENDEIDLIEVFRKIWDGRKTIYKWVGIFFLIGVLIAFGSPNEYKSEVTLLIETGSKSSGMAGLVQQFGGLNGFNFKNGGEEDPLTPELYPEIVKSTPFLLELMDYSITESKYDSTLKVSEYLNRYLKSGIGSYVIGYTLGLPNKIFKLVKGHKVVLKKNQLKSLDSLKLTPEQLRAIGELGRRIKSKKGESSSIFSISVEIQDPAVAAQMVNLVTTNLTKYITDYKTQKAKMDLMFVEERHREAEIRYVKAQIALANYKDRNKNIILASVQSSEQTLQAEYNLAFSIYNSLSQQLEQSKMKVQENTPVFKVVEPAKIPYDKSKPNRNLIIVSMVFLGAFFGLGSLLSKGIRKNIWYKFGNNRAFFL